MNKWTKAILRLNSLTQDKELSWKLVAPPSTVGTNSVVEMAYETEFEGQKLRIFRRRSKVAIDEDRYDWEETPVLQVVDSSGRSLYEFPTTTSGLRELMETVEFQTSNIGPLLDKLAGEG